MVEEQTITVEKQEVEYLENSTVRVEPLKRDGERGLPTSHINNFLMPGAKEKFVANINKYNPIEHLSKEQIAKLASDLGLENPDLLHWKRKDNFFMTRTVELDKYGRTFDLSIPEDYIDIQILKTLKQVVAPNLESRNERPTYRYAICDKTDIDRQKVKKADLMMKVNTELNKLSKKKTNMVNFLTIYYARTGRNVTVSPSMSADALRAELYELSQENPKLFLDIVDDTNFEYTAILEKAIKARLIVGTKAPVAWYHVIDGKKEDMPFAERSVREAIEYLKHPKNQTMYLQLLQGIEKYYNDLE